MREMNTLYWDIDDSELVCKKENSEKILKIKRNGKRSNTIYQGGTGGRFECIVH